MPLSQHAMVNKKNDLTMIIGGQTNEWGSYSNTAKTYYFDHNLGNWSNGPELILPRFGHAAGIITDEATYEKLVVVTGGLYYYFGDYPNSIKTTEVLIGDTWLLGKDFFFFEGPS